jgi:integrase
VPRGHRQDDSWIDGVPDPENPARRLHLLFATELGTVQSLGNIRTRMWVPAMVKANLVDWVALVDARGRPRCDGAGRPMLRAVPRFRLNCLRHLAASLMIEDRLDAKTIQIRMGHGSIQVTYDMYGHLFSRNMQPTRMRSRG